MFVCHVHDAACWVKFGRPKNQRKPEAQVTPP